MYTPSHFQEARHEVLCAAIRKAAFGTLVTFNGGQIVASHIPLLLDESEAPIGTLYGHLARSNPQWRTFDPGVSALVTFVLADSYVSPTWYPTKRESGKVVPTWNYMTVHARGALHLVHDPDALRPIVSRLTDRHEQDRPEPWAVTDAPERYVAGMLKGIVGVAIAVEALEGAWKLSQNRSDADQHGVVQGLQQEDARGEAVARSMATLRGNQDRGVAE